MPDQIAPQTEADNIQQFLDNADSTHNSVVSSSVGMALLHLKKIYLAKNAVNISEKYAYCLTQMKLAAKNNREKLNAIEFLDSQSKRVSELDTINLYLINNNKYENVPTVFPLEEVILLVWLALKDHEKFMHNYAGSSQVQFATARGEYNLRLESFFVCITSMPNNLCHTGIRNDLVFLLNKTYLEIDIIEDARSTVYTIIKEHTNKLFWEHFQAVATTDKKRALTKALMIWINNDNPVPLLGIVDTSKSLKKSLTTLFITHGTDPVYIKLDELILSCLPNVKFNYDPMQYPVIKVIEKIIISAVREENKKILLALNNFKQWLIDCFELQDTIQHEKITAFDHIYHAYKNLNEHNNMLLTITGDMEAGFHDLAEKCESYLTMFAEKDLRREFPLATNDLTELAQRFGVNLAICKANTMSEQVENFFVNWNIAKENRDKAKTKQLYQLLLDEEVFQSKVILQDEEIDAFINIADNSHPYRDITVYQINRIFLHAIIVAVADWSDKFGYLFLDVLNLIGNNFNYSRSFVVSNLMQNSYKYTLIHQLDYYAASFNCIKNQTENTHDEKDLKIVLPQYAKTKAQWLLISQNVSNKKYLEIYQRYKIKINQVVFMYMSQSDNWLVALTIIPSECRAAFIMQSRVLDLIKMKSGSVSELLNYLNVIMGTIVDRKELGLIFQALSRVLEFECKDDFIEKYNGALARFRNVFFEKNFYLLHVFSIVNDTVSTTRLKTDPSYWIEIFTKLPPVKRLPFLLITENNKQLTQPLFIKTIKSHLSENDYYRFLTEIITIEDATVLIDFDEEHIRLADKPLSVLSITNLVNFLDYLNPQFKNWNHFIKGIAILDKTARLPFIKASMQNDNNRAMVWGKLIDKKIEFISIFRDLPETDKPEFLQLFNFSSYFNLENFCGLCGCQICCGKTNKHKEEFIYVVEFMLDKNDAELTRRLNKFIYTFVKTYSALRAAQTSFFKSADWVAKNNILDLPTHEALALIFKHAHAVPHSRTYTALRILNDTYHESSHIYDGKLWDDIYLEGFKKSGIFKKSVNNHVTTYSIKSTFKAIHFHTILGRAFNREQFVTMQNDQNPKTRRGKIFKIMDDRNGAGLNEHLAKIR